MKWTIAVEDISFDADKKPSSTWNPTGEVFDDGFAEDGSEWGDAESLAVSSHLDALKAQDPQARSFSATKVAQSCMNIGVMVTLRLILGAGQVIEPLINKDGHELPPRYGEKVRVEKPKDTLRDKIQDLYERIVEGKTDEQTVEVKKLLKPYIQNKGTRKYKKYYVNYDKLLLHAELVDKLIKLHEQIKHDLLDDEQALQALLENGGIF